MSTGPEIFVHAASDNAVKRNIVGTSLGTMLAGQVLKAISDQDP